MKDAASSRRVQWLLWRLLFAVTLLLLLWPVSYQLTRAVIVCGVPLLVIGLAFLLRDKRRVGFALIAATVVAVIFLILPARNYDRTKLRDEYVRQLTSFGGTKYVWGGENGFGIDCSGLVRRGLINANVSLGLRTLNPGLVRAGLELWWFDCSASALRQEYRGFTTKLYETQSINESVESRLMAGDLAVTSEGIHVLAYVGNKTWIEADPAIRKVVSITTPSDNFWFRQPVHIMRWRQLSPGTIQ